MWAGDVAGCRKYLSEKDMAKLGPEYVGKLPPGAEEALKDELRALRAAGDIVKGVEISGCNDCAVSVVKKNIVYQLNSVPALPLNGCTRSPCCGCCYVGVT